MTRPETATVQCPACGLDQEFTVWSTINVTLDPTLKQRLLNRELTEMICEGCGQGAQVAYDLLYHDLDQKTLIALTVGGGQPPPVPRIEALSGYRLRKVTAFNDLVEKILIFDDGLDDLAIEVLKLAVAARMENGENLELYYAGIGDEPDQGRSLRLAAISDEGENACLSLPLSEAFGPIRDLIDRLRSAGLKEGPDWPLIDRAFVVEAFGRTGLA